MNKIFLLAFFALLFFINLVSAADDFKPYLHKASVPESPKVRLFGQYATNLFPGAATYSYPIEAPKGVNGLQPNVFVSYNSQQLKQRPGVLGAGWSLNQDLVYRDVNSSPDGTSDDKFIMVLDGNLYELVLHEGVYHTEVDYWFRIEYVDDYWSVPSLITDLMPTKINSVADSVKAINTLWTLITGGNAYKDLGGSANAFVNAVVSQTASLYDNANDFVNALLGKSQSSGSSGPSGGSGGRSESSGGGISPFYGGSGLYDKLGGGKMLVVVILK